MTITSSARYILINLMSFIGSRWINVKNVMATASRKTVIIQERIKMKRKMKNKYFFKHDGNFIITDGDFKVMGFMIAWIAVLLLFGAYVISVKGWYG